MRILEMIKYPVLDGIFLPFKIHNKSGVKIKKNVVIKLGSRITLGNPVKNKAIVSRLPINLYFGNQSKINISHSVSIGPGVNIIVKENANLSIGANTYFTSDMHIEVIHSLQIGADCAISWGVTIIDDNHHEIISSEPSSKSSKNVKIGDHVWIGCNVTILKGTQIGNNCIVAAGSIVSGFFGDNVLIAGNPAKVVKQSVNWK